MTTRSGLFTVILLLLSALSVPAGAAGGRGDHDTPATQRQSEFGSAQGNGRACRLDNDGWTVCRDNRGEWRRQATERRYKRRSHDDSFEDWLWRVLD